MTHYFYIRDRKRSFRAAEDRTEVENEEEKTKICERKKKYCADHGIVI